MVIPLASYFGVSADEILGLDTAENERKINAYFDEYRRLNSIGKDHEAYELTVRAYEEYPNDWRIIEKYMWALNYDPNCKDPYGNEVHKDELYRLCDRVLDECTLDSARYSALSILGGLYVLDGDTEKAVETAKRLPPMYLCQEIETENCFDRGTKEWWEQSRKTIWEIMYELQVHIRNAALWSDPSDPTEQIRLLKKSVSLIKLIFDDEDYGFCHYDLGELYLWIANRYVMLDDIDTAVQYYEKGFYHAKMFDDLPRMRVHTSALVRDLIHDGVKTNSSCEENEVARELEYIRSCDIWDKIKDIPEIQEIIAKYEPFAGKKKDYSKE